MGVLAPSISYGMISSTLFSQLSLVCAGFFVVLHPYIEWVRFVTPMYYTFGGMVKAAYIDSDNYVCVGGNSAIGANRCFVELAGSLNSLKKRGINVATTFDDTSNVVWPNILALVAFLLTLQLMIFLSVMFRVYTRPDTAAKDQVSQCYRLPTESVQSSDVVEIIPVSTEESIRVSTV